MWEAQEKKDLTNELKEYIELTRKIEKRLSMILNIISPEPIKERAKSKDAVGLLLNAFRKFNSVENRSRQRSYRVAKVLQGTDIIPINYLQRRYIGNAVFNSNEHATRTDAMRITLSMMCEQGLIERVDPKFLLDEYDYKGEAYRLTAKGEEGGTPRVCEDGYDVPPKQIEQILDETLLTKPSITTEPFNITSSVIEVESEVEHNNKPKPKPKLKPDLTIKPCSKEAEVIVKSFQSSEPPQLVDADDLDHSLPYPFPLLHVGMSFYTTEPIDIPTYRGREFKCVNHTQNFEYVRVG